MVGTVLRLLELSFGHCGCLGMSFCKAESYFIRITWVQFLLDATKFFSFSDFLTTVSSCIIIFITIIIIIIIIIVIIIIIIIISSSITTITIIIFNDYVL